MTWTYSDESYKQYTRDTWNESAADYDMLLRNLDLYNPELIEAAALRPDDRVLDVATGPGEPALTIAKRLSSQGSVTGIDLSERMVELARENAKARGISNVTFDVMDAEELTLPDASFDVAMCRFGLQIVTDPDKAIAEMYRVLKPGGRFCATVWGPGERVPALHVVVGPMLEHAEPDETGYLPTPYEMGGDNELVGILEKMGFSQAHERRVTHTFHVKDEDEYLRGLLQGSPIGHSMREEPEDVQQQVLKQTRENLQQWKTPEGIRLPAEAVVVSAVKP